MQLVYNLLRCVGNQHLKKIRRHPSRSTYTTRTVIHISDAGIQSHGHHLSIKVANYLTTLLGSYF